MRNLNRPRPAPSSDILRLAPSLPSLLYIGLTLLLLSLASTGLSALLVDPPWLLKLGLSPVLLFLYSVWCILSRDYGCDPVKSSYLLVVAPSMVLTKTLLVWFFYHAVPSFFGFIRARVKLFSDPKLLVSHLWTIFVPSYISVRLLMTAEHNHTMPPDRWPGSCSFNNEPYTFAHSPEPTPLVCVLPIYYLLDSCLLLWQIVLPLTQLNHNPYQITWEYLVLSHLWLTPTVGLLLQPPSETMVSSPELNTTLTALLSLGFIRARVKFFSDPKSLVSHVWTIFVCFFYHAVSSFFGFIRARVKLFSDPKPLVSHLWTIFVSSYITARLLMTAQHNPTMPPDRWPGSCSFNTEPYAYTHSPEPTPLVCVLPIYYLLDSCLLLWQIVLLLTDLNHNPYQTTWEFLALSHLWLTPTPVGLLLQPPSETMVSSPELNTTLTALLLAFLVSSGPELSLSRAI